MSAEPISMEMYPYHKKNMHLTKMASLLGVIATHYLAFREVPKVIFFSERENLDTLLLCCIARRKYIDGNGSIF